MQNGKKDFFKVTELSERWAQFEKEMETKQVPDARTIIHFELIQWQIRAQLAIAQQMTIISAHLGEIVGKAK